MTMFKKGYIPWNKGLTIEEDKRLAQPCLGRCHTKERIEKIRAGNLGKEVSKESRLRISLSKRGNKSHFWKGGVSKPHEIIRKSTEYKLWREAVFKRDNYMCIWGGKAHGYNLHADHIKPFCLYPELRFAIDNGRTLCIKCHKTTETYGRRKNEK